MTPRRLIKTPSVPDSNLKGIKFDYHREILPSTGQKSTSISRKLIPRDPKSTLKVPIIDTIDFSNQKSTPCGQKLTPRGLKFTPRRLMKTPRVPDLTPRGLRFDYQNQNSPSTSKKSTSIARKWPTWGHKSTPRGLEIDSIDFLEQKSTPRG